MSDTTRWQETLERITLAWRLLTERDDNLVRYARDEALRVDADLAAHLTSMARVFALEGHSGCSAPWAVGALRRVLSFEPLSPITGEDAEWVEVADGMWQNRRCSRVFKGRDGAAYDIEGRVFRDPDGFTYTNRGSRVSVVFPYTPKTEYVDAPTAGEGES